MANYKRKNATRRRKWRYLRRGYSSEGEQMRRQVVDKDHAKQVKELFF